MKKNLLLGLLLSLSILGLSLSGIAQPIFYSPIDTTQDYFDYLETDVSGKVTIAENTITLTDGDRDEDYYVTKDFGAGYFTDFVHWVDVNVTAQTDDNSSGFSCWALSNADDDLKDIQDANDDVLMLWVGRVLDATHYQIVLYDITGGSLTKIDSSVNWRALNVTSYLAISRNIVTVTIEQYSTAALRIAGGAGDIDTVTGTCINTAFRYVYGLGSYNRGDVGKDISGTASNLKLNINRIPIYFNFRSQN